VASSTRSKPAAKKTASKVASKATAKKVSKVVAKPAAKVAAKAVTKKVAAKAVTKTVSKAATKTVSKVVPRTESKVKAKTSSRKAPDLDDDDDDDDDNSLHGGHHHEPTPVSIKAQQSSGPVLPDDLADVAAQQAAALEPEVPSSPRRKSVLEVAEEDDDFESEPPMPTADNIDGLLDRLRKVAQFGGDALEELPRLIEQLEQIDDPAVMPRLLGLLEDNDPYGIYWNVLYVLEKFDDAYLRALLDGVEALYARAPQWAYTCVIRILNTRGDEDDCTAAFEKLVQASPPTTRTLAVQILRELSADPDTDTDQKANIARTLTAVGGNTPAAESPARPAE
jgi:hypothetical protein